MLKIETGKVEGTIILVVLSIESSLQLETALIF